MAIAMVAMLAFGGTYAYFSAQINANTDTLTTATIKLTTGTAGSFTTTYASAVLPGDTVSAGITLSDGSNRGTWIFFSVATSVTAGSLGSATDLAAAISNVKVGDATATETETNSGIYYIKVEDATAAASDYSTKNTYAVTATVTITGTAHYDEKTSDGASSNLGNLGATVTVTFKASSIQLSAGSDAKAAYTALTTAVSAAAVR